MMQYRLNTLTCCSFFGNMERRKPRHELAPLRCLLYRIAQDTWRRRCDVSPVVSVSTHSEFAAI